tara:strand:+ start:2214 stop:2915 length:702 start_codon:yes stop_codon:yes gene_type:complete
MISIVTVCYNAAEDLKLTLASLKYNLEIEYELIVIDGNSMDNTRSIINQFDNVSIFISEEDDGIYDAMTKGVKLASYDWVFFLNAGDVIFSDFFFNNFVLKCNKNIDAYYGDVAYTDGHIVHSMYNLKILLHNTIHHQSIIYNRQLLLDYPYDRSYKRFSDYHLNLRSFLSKRKFLKISGIAAICDPNGISRDSNSLLSIRYETNAVRSSLLPSKYAFILKLIYRVKFWLKNV